MNDIWATYGEAIVGGIVQVIAGVPVSALIGAIGGGGVASWASWRIARSRVRVETREERGPVTRGRGFTESAIKITVHNRRRKQVRVRDIRVMLSRDYGAPVQKEAPPGRTHVDLPEDLESGDAKSWYVPAEQLANLIALLHHPPSMTEPEPMVRVYVRCITGTGRVYRSRAFRFATDVNSHWHGPLGSSGAS